MTIMFASLSVLAYSGSLRIDVTVLLKAFERVESSGVLHAKGDFNKKTNVWESHGLFQFKIDRWMECGGPRLCYLQAPRALQEIVMLNAIRRYIVGCPTDTTLEQKITWIGWGHNGGKQRVVHKAYTRKLWKAYKEIASGKDVAAKSKSKQKQQCGKGGGNRKGVRNNRAKR